MQNKFQMAFQDWVVITFRWIFLLGTLLWMASRADFDISALVLLIFASVANIVWTILLGLKQPARINRLLSLFGDLLVVHILFVFFLPMGVFTGWSAVLPVITAAVYFRWWGVFAVGLFSLLIQGVTAGLLFTLPNAYLLVGMVLFVSLLIGLPLSFLLSRQMPVIKTQASIPSIETAIQADGEQDRSSIIYRLISELGASLNYQQVLQTALDLSASSLASMDAPVDGLVSAVFLFTPQEQGGTLLQTAYARGLSLPDMRLTMTGTRGFIGKVIDEGASGVTREVRTDPELNRFVAFSHIQAVYCAPLRSGLDTYGIILFAHLDENFFLPDRCEILDIVSNQTAIALQNALLFRDLEQEKERMIEVQENSRKKLARELHDGPTQTVAAIAMRVNFARRLMEKDSKAAMEELIKIEELARKTTKEIRHMLFTLRPLILESQGLVAALRSMAEKMKETFNQDVSIDADERVVDALEQTKQGVVFYIAEEAVNNARKHAQAPHIAVRLKMVGDDLSFLEIQDDGVGFNPDLVEASYGNRGSLGMLNMRERTEQVNGVLRIESAPGSGTRVQVAIPLTDAAAERLRRGVKA